MGCQGKGTEDFSRPADKGKYSKGKWVFKPGNYYHEKPYLWLWTHSYSDKRVLRGYIILLQKFDT